MTRPTGHLAGGVISLVNITKSPTSSDIFLVLHLPLGCKLVKYSDDQRDQKSCAIWVINCHLLPAGTLILVTSGSGIKKDCRWIRKCEGDKNGGSKGSSGKDNNGRELRQASIFASNVAISTNVKIWLPITLFK